MKKYLDDLNQALHVLRSGGIILYPTDTIWGIGCDATNSEAIDRIYKLKQRPDSRSMLVLLDNDVKLNSYVEDVPDIAWDLIDVTDKPLTIIYPGAKNLPDNLISHEGTIGIRITREEFSSELIRRFGKPLVSTSANISGQPSPSTFNEIAPKITEKVDYVVTYRQNDKVKKQASSILRIGTKGEIEILRH